MKMKRLHRTTTALLALVPFAWLAACGGGGGDGSSTAGNGSTSEHLPASTEQAIRHVPLAGELVADCSDVGVGFVDSVVDATNGLSGNALPAQIPTLSEVVALADLSKVPVIGGQLVDAMGHLQTLTADQALALLPTGAPGLSALPVTGQLPAVCSSLLGALPAGATTDPATLLAALGDPSSALALIPIFDASNDPVGVVLATLPSGLLPGSGLSLPGVGNPPDLTSLAPLDSSTVPVLGPALSSLVGSLLGTLNGNGLLGGNLLATVLGLLP